MDFLKIFFNHYSYYILQLIKCDLLKDYEYYSYKKILVWSAFQNTKK